jgi:hypothetical protein
LIDVRKGAESFYKVAQEFFDSFQNRAKIEWEQISSPFRRHAQKDDLRDFLAAEDSVDDGEEEVPQFLAHRQLQQDSEEIHNAFVANNSPYSRFNDHAHPKKARNRGELK